MNSFQIVPISEALKLLQSGQTIRMVEQPVLFQLSRTFQVLVSASGYTCRCSIPDFLELYRNQSFILHESGQGIDEKKDEAYYAWARKYQ